jgi:hypothetical protein
MEREKEGECVCGCFFFFFDYFLFYIIKALKKMQNQFSRLQHLSPSLHHASSEGNNGKKEGEEEGKRKVRINDVVESTEVPAQDKGLPQFFFCFTIFVVIFLLLTPISTHNPTLTHAHTPPCRTSIRLHSHSQ